MARGAEIPFPGRSFSAPQDHGGNLREMQRKYGLTEVVDFSASINPLGCPEGLRERLMEAWDAVLHYPDRNCAPFRAAVSDRFGVPEACVVPGNGSAELIDLVLRVLAPGRLLVCPPDFGLYERLAPEETPLVEMPRRVGAGFTPDLQGLAEAVRPGDAVIFSNPGNPSGRVLPPGDLDPFLDHVEKVGATVILDEAFADFCPEMSLLERAWGAGGLVALRSLTKFYGIPGLRLGFLVASPRVAAAVAARQVPWSVNTLAQEAGTYCLAQRDWDRRTLAYVGRARERLARRLARLPGLSPLPSAANYLLVRVSPPAPPAGVLYEGAARRGVLIRHCGSFGLGEEYLRVAVRREEENELLAEVLGRVLGVGSSSGKRMEASPCP